MTLFLAPTVTEGKKKYPLPKRYIKSCEADMDQPNLDYMSFSAHHYGSDWPSLGNMSIPVMRSKMSSI